MEGINLIKSMEHKVFIFNFRIYFKYANIYFLIKDQFILLIESFYYLLVFNIVHYFIILLAYHIGLCVSDFICVKMF